MPLPSRKNLVCWSAGVLSALTVLAAGALVVVEAGLFDVAATTPDDVAESVTVHQAMINSVRRRAAAIQAPAHFTGAQVTAGLKDYAASCTMCHGGPGLPQSPLAHGMTPPPPYIVDAARRWRARELYWIIAHGVKMTAMPSWESIRGKAQIWDIVAFLEAVPYLSPREFDRIRTSPDGVNLDVAPVVASGT